MGRNLSVDSFGTINAIFSTLPVLAVPATALTSFITKKVSASKDSGSISASLSRVLRYLLLACFILLITSLFFVPYLTSVFYMQSPSVLIISIIIVIVFFYVPVYQGTLAGIQKFFILGLIGIILPVSRLSGTILTSMAPGQDILQQNIILFSFALGAFLTVAVGFGYLHFYGLRYTSKRNLSTDTTLFQLTEYGSMVFVTLGLMFFMNIDIIMIRFFHGGEIAGDYSSMQIFARIAYFATTSLVVVMLPIVAKQHSKKENPLSLLKITLLYTVIISFIIYVPLILLSEYIIALFLGSKFTVSPVIMLFSCLITFSLSLNTVISNYMIGVGKSRRLAIISAISCVISAVFMFLFRFEISFMLISLFSVGFIMFFICLANCIYFNFRAKNC